MAKTDKKIRIFSALEIANICGVVNQTAINWIKNGYLKAFTTPGGQYRVYAEDLIEFLKSRGMRMPIELEELHNARSVAEKVLVVDDEIAFNNIVRDMIEKNLEDFEITQAFDGFEAGKKVTEETPGIIVLDVDLPGLNGYDLCKKIKSDASLGNPFIIAVSGLDDPDVEKKILRNGADAFLSKPFDFDTLIELIKEFSEKRAVS